MTGLRARYRTTSAGPTTQQAKVLYIAAEGAYGLGQRISAWEHAWGWTIPDGHLVVSQDRLNLMDGVDVRDLARAIRDEQFSFVIVDTLARCIVGADENTSRDMGIAIDSLDRLRALLAQCSRYIIPARMAGHCEDHPLSRAPLTRCTRWSRTAGIHPGQEEAQGWPRG